METHLLLLKRYILNTVEYLPTRVEGGNRSGSWNSNTLATWCEELTHLKRSWCWKRLRAGGEGDDRGWDGWMASPTQWTWVWVDSGSWWWTGRPGVLQFMGSQRVGQNWATELNWTFFNTLQNKELKHNYVQVHNFPSDLAWKTKLGSSI